MSATQPAPRIEPRHLPISFSDPLIPRVLDGSKTQTRRILPSKDAAMMDAIYSGAAAASGMMVAPHLRCPYGDHDDHDRLWVREGLRRNESGLVSYSADGALALRDGKPVAWPWKPKRLPSRYCPRWASRIDLEIAEVRVQRLAEINEEDAIAEGVTLPDCSYLGDRCNSSRCPRHRGDAHRAQFSELWDSINAGRGFGWDANPWCWAISFRRVRP